MEWWRRPVAGSRTLVLAAGIVLAVGGLVVLVMLWTQPLNVVVDGATQSCDVEFGAFVPGCSEAESDRAVYRLVAVVSTGIGLVMLMNRRHGSANRVERLDGRSISIHLATPRDAGSYLETITDSIRLANGWTEEHVDAAVAAIGQHAGSWNYVIRTRPGVADRERIVGALSAAVEHDGSISVGGWVHDRWQQHGFGTEALQLLVDALAANGSTAVHAECATTNAPVRSLLEATDFTVSGSLTRRLPDDSFIDAIRYSRYSDLLDA